MSISLMNPLFLLLHIKNFFLPNLLYLLNLPRLQVLGSSLKFARARTRGFHTIAMSGTPSTTCSQPETPKKVTAKGKSKGQKNQKLPDDQIYDFARKEGPDPRDPRFKGGPCKGQHVEAPFGRGSPSGKNGWAMWKTCQNCMLRLEYIPAYGAHAKYRSAGPLSTDTKDQLIEKANEIEKDPSVLRTAEVALDGAERSLHRRLETIQKQKEALKKDKTKDEPQAMRTTTPTQRKSKRTGSQGAEALEAAAEESDGSWTEMPPTGAN